MSPVVDGVIHGVNPWTLEPLPGVVVTSQEELNRAVHLAKNALIPWAHMTVHKRARFLKRAVKRIIKHRAHGLTVVSQELGKVPADALFTEVLGPLDALSGWLRVIDGAPAGDVSLNPVAFPGKQARIDLVPHGVIGIIAPWNFPMSGLYRSVFPALLLGNSVVVKPSEYSPRSTAWFLEQLALELPQGLIQVVQGDGETGAALVRSDIDACIFTGSTYVGKLVERTCFDRGVPCSAELGGNDAAIVLHDADLNRTVAGITHWALQNAGQSCGAVKLLYADRAIAPVLIERLSEVWQRLRPSASSTPSGSVAPLAFAAQRDLVLGRIAQAQALGARVLVGGKTYGMTIEPTLLIDCTEEMDLVREETFGPVLPIIVVDDENEAIERVNQGGYGLTTSLWTRDVDRATRLAQRLDVGVVTVNNHALTGAIVDLPWSGRRNSGRGVANSAWSLGAFARPKAVLVDRSTSLESYWMPYDDTLEELGNSLAEAQLGNWTKLLAVPRLMSKRAADLRGFFELH